MIARALIAKPRLLVLDEATTGLDRQTEDSILANLVQVKEDMAVLAISHQSAVKMVADFTYDFEKA
jgi:ABC-type bacteriocin/lantibiotic exporter with double-glycine peptidase domain